MARKERIKELCDKKGISAKQLEETLGLGKGYVSKVDKSKPNMSKIQPIADFFNVPIGYILNGESKFKKEKVEFSIQAVIDAVSGKILQELKDMSEEDKEEVLRYARYRKQLDKTNKSKKDV